MACCVVGVFRRASDWSALAGKVFILHIMNNREQKVSIFNDDYNDLLDSAHEHLKFLNKPIDRDEQPSNEPTVANITKLMTLGE